MMTAHAMAFKPNISQSTNIAYHTKGDKLYIEIDLSQDIGRTKNDQIKVASQWNWHKIMTSTGVYSISPFIVIKLKSDKLKKFKNSRTRSRGPLDKEFE